MVKAFSLVVIMGLLSGCLFTQDLEDEAPAVVTPLPAQDAGVDADGSMMAEDMSDLDSDGPEPCECPTLPNVECEASTCSISCTDGYFVPTSRDVLELGCPCTSEEEGCPTSNVVFVHARSLSGGSGSMDSPFQTISDALGVGSGELWVFVSEEEIEDSVLLQSHRDVFLVGGYEPSSWERLPDAKTPWSSSSSPVLTVTRGDEGGAVHVERFVIVGPDFESRPGTHSIAVAVRGASNLTLHTLEIEGGSGGHGVAGEPGMDALASSGQPPVPCLDGHSSGAGGLAGGGGVCEEGLTPQSGYQGEAVGVLPGGDGGAGGVNRCDFDDTHLPGEEGNPGLAGAPGVHGTPDPVLTLHWDGNEFAVDRGSLAGSGGAGSGGGGGGGGGGLVAVPGSPGGPGGAGGCGGGPGGRGEHGGWSIGLFLVEASPRFVDVRIRLGVGGDGGDGGPGGCGGRGAVGESSTIGTTPGSAGGTGGVGGNGGPGGSGAGGNGGGSIGVLSVGGVTLTGTDIDTNSGEPGTPGQSMKPRNCLDEHPDEPNRGQSFGKHIARNIPLE